MNSGREIQHSQEQDQMRREHRSSLPRLQTQANPVSNRFSYTRTPAVAQGEGFEQQSQHRPHLSIEEEPIHSEAFQQQPAQGAHVSYPDVRKSPSPDLTQQILHHQSFSQPSQAVHPAHYAPYAEDSIAIASTSLPADQQQSISYRQNHHEYKSQYDQHTQQQSQQQQQYYQQYQHSYQFSGPPNNQSHGLSINNNPQISSLPHMTYPPMPQSPPHYRSPTKEAADRDVRDDENDDDVKDGRKEPAPTSPTGHVPAPLDLRPPEAPFHNYPSVPGSPRTPAYTPQSPLGPNSSAFHMGHMPGQISHPLHSAPKTWQSSTLSPSSTCLGSLFCPCITYGKVQHRLAQLGRKQQATDLLAYRAVNSDCGLFAALAACGLCGLLATVQRTRTRRAYEIEGSVVGDCLRGCCCCCCCAVALNEREIVAREEHKQRLTGPVTSQYASHAQMAFPTSLN